MKAIKTTIYLFFLLLLGFSAQSQSDHVSILSIDDMPKNKKDKHVTITTASKRAEKISDAPATIYVISQDDINKRGYFYLKDVLRDLPGMETIENYFSEIGTLVPVRGVVGNNKLLILLNGTRVNPPGGEEAMLRSDISIANAKQIEVIYGPSSTLYGQDAISAVINIITEDPDEKAHFNVGLRGGTQSYMGGTISFSKKISLRTGSELKFHSYVDFVDTELTDISDSYPDYWQYYSDIAAGTGRGAVPARWDKGFNAFLKVESRNTSVQLWHRESSRSSSEGGYTPILQYINEAKWKDRSTTFQILNNLTLNGNVNVESSLSYNRYEIVPGTRYVFPISSTDLFFDDYKYGLGTSLRLEEKVSFDVGSKLSVIAGVLAAFYDISPKATILGGVNTTQDFTFQGGTLDYFLNADDTDPVSVSRASNVAYENFAAYIENRFTLSERLKLILGLRVDVNNRFDDSPFSPRAALLFDLTDKINFKYIFNKAFVAPPPYFQYNVYDNGANISTTNEDLQPERATSNEFNISYVDEKLSVTSAFYYNEQENILQISDRGLPVNVVQDEVYLKDESGAVTGTRKLIRSANGGKSRAFGFDLFGKYSTEKYSLWASYSFVDYEEELEDATIGLTQISPHNLRLGLSYRILPKLSITPSFIFRTTPKNVANTFDLDSELENPFYINLNAVYEISNKWQFFLNGINITNNKTALRGIISPTPQEAINFKLGARFSYHKN